MEKLFAVLDLFRKGNAVADPAAWKAGSVGLMALVPMLLALDRLATSFGYSLGMDAKNAADIAVGLLAVVGVVSHVVSSEKIGLPAKPAPDNANGPADTTYLG